MRQNGTPDGGFNGVPSHPGPSKACWGGWEGCGSFHERGPGGRTWGRARVTCPAHATLHRDPAAPGLADAVTSSPRCHPTQGTLCSTSPGRPLSVGSNCDRDILSARPAAVEEVTAGSSRPSGGLDAFHEVGGTLAVPSGCPHFPSLIVWETCPHTAGPGRGGLWFHQRFCSSIFFSLFVVDVPWK